MSFDSGKKGEINSNGSKERSVPRRLISVPIGRHYLILYSDIQMARKVYSAYIKAQIDVQPHSVIVVLPYYDTSEKVREVLESNGVDVKRSEKEGNLIIVDIEKVFRSDYYAVSEVERLRAFTKHLENIHVGKTVFVIADMSIFNHLKRRELLYYKRNLHQTEKLKELFFCHENDFKAMFTVGQGNELLDYQKDTVISV
jgi:hypothetical protein